MLDKFQYVSSRDYVQEQARSKFVAEGFYEKMATRRKREQARIRKLAADVTPEELGLLTASSTVCNVFEFIFFSS